MPSKRPDDTMSGHQNTMAGDGAFADDLAPYQLSAWLVDGAAGALNSGWATVADNVPQQAHVLHLGASVMPSAGPFDLLSGDAADANGGAGGRPGGGGGGGGSG